MLTRSSHISENGCARSDRPHFSIYSPSVTTQYADVDNPTISAEQASPAEGPDLPTPGEGDANPAPDTDHRSSQEPEKAKEEAKSTEKPADPLRWFGILVPPALRTAQSTFVSAVEGPIPQLATIVKDLRTQEIEIGRVKKQIKKM
jgi:hypothetical protein